MSTPTIGVLLKSYFEDHLKSQKGLRPATIRSYRDAIVLFLAFVSEDRGCRLTRLQVPDLTAERVRRFLDMLEMERRNHVRSRNQRLVGLRGFFDYHARRVTESGEEAERVAGIPAKRAAPARMHYLEIDQIEGMFAAMKAAGALALRDRTLLLFLYNTGARAQEVADLRLANLELDRHRVHLHGKGDKWRSRPLWKITVSMLNELLGPLAGTDGDRPVFVSQRGQALTRFGIYKIVRRHTEQLVQSGPRATGRGISPHVIRHSTAVHLLESGVEPNVIRDWLGHVSVETTNRYAEITIAMKEKALETCLPPLHSDAAGRKGAVWRDDPTLLKWLKSL